MRSPSSLRRRVAALVAAVLSAGLLAAPLASAEVVRLRGGETIRGRVIQERTNEKVLVIEDFLVGTVRELSWDAIDPEDVTRIAGGLHLLFGASDLSIPCERIDYKLENGTVTQIVCVVEREEGGNYFVRNSSQKDAFPILKSRVVAREKDFCDPWVIWPREALAAQKKADLNPQESREWFEVARYCEDVGAYKEAKEAYEVAASDEAFLNRKAAQDGVKRCEVAIQDKEAMDDIIAMKNRIGAGQWKSVREGIDGFAAKHPSVGEVVTKKLEALKTEFATRRTKYFAEMAGRRLEPIMREAIRKRVGPRDAEYNSIQGWIRKEAIEEVSATLLAEMQKADPLVTPEEVKTFFEGRPKKIWKKARYGTGSRFIENPKVLPKTGTKQPTQPQRSGGGSNAPAPVMKLPEPAGKDDWWRDLPGDARIEFWWAVFVEKSGLFEVDPKKERIPCDKCLGEGTIPYVMSNGIQAVGLCPRCGGLRSDLVVKYR